jgi:integrase
MGLKWDNIKLESRLIILPMTKNNTVRVLPINDRLYRILSEMPQKSVSEKGTLMQNVYCEAHTEPPKLPTSSPPKPTASHRNLTPQETPQDTGQLLPLNTPKS